MTADSISAPERDKSPLRMLGDRVQVRRVLRQYVSGFTCAAALGAAAGVMAAPWRLPDTVAALLTVAAATFAVVAGFLAVVTVLGAVTELVTASALRRRITADAEVEPATVALEREDTHRVGRQPSRR